MLMLFRVYAETATMSHKKTIDRRRLVGLAAGTAALAGHHMLLGCKPAADQNSEIKFLNIQGGYTCPAVAARTAQVEQKYGAIIDGSAQGDDRAAIIGSMTNLPDVYLDFLLGTQGFRIFVVPGFGEPYPWAAGLCHGGMGGAPPQKVELAKFKGPGCEHVTLHELGHACHGFTEDRTGSRGAIQTLFSEISGGQHPEASQVWSYGKQNVNEFFAVVFSTWYCPAARASMQGQFPKIHQVFSSIFGQMDGASPSGPGPLACTGPRPQAVPSLPQGQAPLPPAFPQPLPQFPQQQIVQMPQSGQIGSGQPPAGGADLAALLAIIMGMPGGNGNGLTLTEGKRLGLVQPLWKEMEATSPETRDSDKASILFRVGVEESVGRASDLKIEAQIEGRSKPLALDGRFQQDAYVDHLYSANVRMPLASAIFDRGIQDVERKMTVIISLRGKEVGRRDYTLVKKHVDGITTTLQTTMGKRT